MDSNHRYPAKFFWRPVDPRAIHTFRNINRRPRDRDRWFESISLQRRVCELSVPLLSRPEGDVRGIGFQTVRTYIAIGNSEARGAMLARTIFGVAENSQAYRGPRARHPPRIEAF